MSLIQREGRPALDISPDATPNTAAWETQYNNPMNELNKPVPERKGAPEANGWTKEAYDVNQTKEIE